MLLIDVRKTCRRTKDGKGCHQFKRKEAAILTLMTALEIKVAMEVFNIGVCSVVSFAEVRYDQWPASNP